MTPPADTLEREQGELMPGAKFCGLIYRDRMPEHRKPGLREDVVERLNRLQGDSDRVYVSFLHRPLRIERRVEGPGNRVISFIVEGAPNAEGVYTCAALSVIEHVDGNTYYERHCGRERKTPDGDIETVDEWALEPDDIHTADDSDEDFIVRATREAQPLPVAA